VRLIGNKAPPPAWAPDSFTMQKDEPAMNMGPDKCGWELVKTRTPINNPKQYATRILWMPERTLGELLRHLFASIRPQVTEEHIAQLVSRLMVTSDQKVLKGEFVAIMATDPNLSSKQVNLKNLEETCPSGNQAYAYVSLVDLKQELGKLVDQKQDTYAEGKYPKKIVDLPHEDVVSLHAILRRLYQLKHFPVEIWAINNSPLLSDWFIICGTRRWAITLELPPVNKNKAARTVLQLLQKLEGEPRFGPYISFQTNEYIKMQKTWGKRCKSVGQGSSFPVNVRGKTNWVKRFSMCSGFFVFLSGGCIVLRLREEFISQAWDLTGYRRLSKRDCTIEQKVSPEVLFGFNLDRGWWRREDLQIPFRQWTQEMKEVQYEDYEHFFPRRCQLIGLMYVSTLMYGGYDVWSRIANFLVPKCMAKVIYNWIIERRAFSHKLRMIEKYGKEGKNQSGWIGYTSANKRSTYPPWMSWSEIGPKVTFFSGRWIIPGTHARKRKRLILPSNRTSARLPIVIE